MFNRIIQKSKLLQENGGGLLLETGIGFLIWTESEEFLFNFFKPLNGFKETFEWKTDILTTKTSEQRICLRKNPRIFFDLSFHLDLQEFREMKAILMSLKKTKIIYPHWNDAILVSLINSGSNTIEFDTSQGVYSIDNYAIIFKNEDLILRKIININSNSIQFEDDIDEDLIDYLVCPAQLVVIEDLVDFRRTPKDNNIASLKLRSLLNNDESENPNYPFYQSLPVLMIDQPILEGINEKIGFYYENFDNETGIVENELIQYSVGRLFTCNFLTKTIKERSDLKRFFHYLKGRFKTFWMPSFNNDMKLKSNISSSATSMQVHAFGFGYYYNGEQLNFVIEMKDGTLYFNKIISSNRDQITETFNLSSNFGVTILHQNVKRIMFIHKCRLETDTIEINHIDKKHTSVSLIVKEVSQ